MSSDRRSSMSSIRSAISRTSMGSHRPATPPMGERRPPSPLTQPSPGVPTLSPPVIGKGGLPPPMTPQRKPVQRQKSPLSAEAFSSPASAMPGSFPDETTASPQPQDDSPAPGSRSKRLSSMSKLLPFKALRRSYDASSPQSSDSPDFRPKTPGGESVLSDSKPSLRKRVSGSFWRRKSSMGAQFTPGDADAEPRTSEAAAAASPSSPRANGFATHEAIQEDPRPSSPTLADSNSPTVKKRKSGTFWRRTSSLTLTQTVNVDRQGWARKTSEGPNSHPIGNGRATRASEDLQASSRLERKVSGSNSFDKKPTRKVSDRKPLPAPPKTPSPPPQLPPFTGAGGGLGLDEGWLDRF